MDIIPLVAITAGTNVPIRPSAPGQHIAAMVFKTIAQTNPMVGKGKEATDGHKFHNAIKSGTQQP